MSTTVMIVKLQVVRVHEVKAWLICNHGKFLFQLLDVNSADSCIAVD